MDDHYEILEVRPDAPPEVIAAAYRALRKVYGTDGTRQDRRRLEAVDRAHAVLSDPDTRRSYDAERQERRASGAMPATEARPRPRAAPHPDGSEPVEEPETTTDVEDRNAGPEYVDDEDIEDVTAPPRGRSGSDPHPPPNRRVAAALVDLSIVAVVGLVWYLLAAVLVGQRSTSVTSAGWYLAFGVIHVGIQGRTGHTPGKHLNGLRAVRADGRPPGISWILVPFALLLVTATRWGALVALGLALVAKRPDRGLEDMVTRTYVVRTEHAGRPVTAPALPWSEWLKRQSRRPPALRGRRIVAQVFERRSIFVLTVIGVLVLVVSTGLGAIGLAAHVWSAVADSGSEPQPEYRKPVINAIWQAHRDEVTALAFSPDGGTVATASIDGTARLWDTGTAVRRAVLDHRDEVTYLAFSDDGTVLTTANDAETRRWDVRTHEELAVTATGRLPADEPAVALSPDGTLLARPGAEATVGLRDVATDEPKDDLVAHNAEVLALAFSPDGNLLASADAGGQVVLWDTRA